MPANQFSQRVNLDYLNPTFLQHILDLLVEAKLLGFIYKVYSGYRSMDEQRVLYQLHVQGGPLAAPAGLSAHNYGLAVDMALLQPDGTVSWKDADLAPLADLCKKHQLDWGGHFGDKPHAGMLNYVTGSQLLPLKQIYNLTQGDELTKLKEVWQNVR